MLPLDRNGSRLFINDSVDVYFPEEHTFIPGKITGFDPFPPYDASVIGILVDINPDASLHPSLVVKPQFNPELRETLRVRRAHLLLKTYLAHRSINKSRRPGCEWNAFMSSDCCSFHRQLAAKWYALEGIARHLNVAESSGPFNSNWWRAFGKEFNIPLPVELLE